MWIDVRDGGWVVRRVWAERTWNMPYMVVTLEVSKLSGWLNADAYCRAEKEEGIRHAGRGASWKTEGVG